MVICGAAEVKVIFQQFKALVRRKHNEYYRGAHKKIST